MEEQGRPQEAVASQWSTSGRENLYSQKIRGEVFPEYGLSRQAVLGLSDSKFVGAIAENYVAQQMAARGETLHYWESQGRAELDFVLQKDAEIRGIQVKSGLNVHSRSLSVFCGKYPSTKPVRISLRNYGTDGSLVTVPLYAAHCL